MLRIGPDPFFPRSSPGHSPQPKIDFPYQEISGPDICSLICESFRTFSVPVFHKPVFWSVTFLGYTQYNKVVLVEMSWSINYFLSCFSKSLVEGAESPLTRESPAGSLNKKNFVYNSRSEAALGTIHILRNQF